MTTTENISLKNYNTFGIDVAAAKMIVIQQEADIVDFISTKEQDTDFLILGGGSNLLFTQDVQGCVLKNEIKGVKLVSETKDEVYIKVGAGENWHKVVLHCVAMNWGGLENLSLIPGCVGAAPIQNIGAYGVELKDVFQELEAIHLQTGEKKVFSLEECAFGYRDSVFKNALKGQYFITSVTFCLHKNPILNTSYGDIEKELKKLPHKEYSIKDVSNAVIAIRQSKLPNPAEIGNAGSFFKNPIIPNKQFSRIRGEFPEIPFYPISASHTKIPAAWLIQQCGWKGKNLGNYGVHAKQALVLVNYGGASGKDIYQLSTDILASVKKEFGIELEREVNII